MAKKSKSKFIVDTIRADSVGDIGVFTAVLKPAKGNDFFGDNPVARIEIARLDREQIKGYEIGTEIEVELYITVP